MDVDSSARELGRLIAQTPEYKYYSQCAKDVDQDEETSRLLQNLKACEQEVMEAQKQGRDISEEMKAAYTRQLQEVQGKSMIKALIASQENYLKLMDKVNQRISEGIRDGAQSRIITNF
ncbi:MAG: hypothetical protein A3F83_11075 [Candidatus Glassbacteria bacterium RIFCSPLOWO2_12_FULL_58_11]|uniref:YlbF family regulator n=1 Tax=Candidatus Glassbacteria bacterium RIFCSPLOWO2_12_FULL_58_11 TaxID=1817867 RepID=A0A1F5YWJ7_9BACT|nr:MAG: hypothetical protein A3F83_11075 [Candidatus Glassbacteria bacterium RIFCSPLOWO2_12_FULL_58_11]